MIQPQTKRPLFLPDFIPRGLTIPYRRVSIYPDPPDLHTSTLRSNFPSNGFPVDVYGWTRVLPSLCQFSYSLRQFPGSQFFIFLLLFSNDRISYGIYETPFHIYSHDIVRYAWYSRGWRMSLGKPRPSSGMTNKYASGRCYTTNIRR